MQATASQDSIIIKDHMREQPVTIGPDAPLVEAVQSILKHRISGLCVVDQDHNLLGVLSELDCLKGYISATYNRGAVGSVSEYMTVDIDVANAHHSVINVAEEMLQKGQRRRPVVEGGKLIGQITCRQLLQVVERFANLKTA